MAGDLIQSAGQRSAPAHSLGGAAAPPDRLPELGQMHRARARVQRELEDLRQSQQRLRAQQAITRALAESSSVAEASPRIFAALCATLDCDWAELWRVSPAGNVLHCVQTWQPRTGPTVKLERASRRLACGRGEGIAGTVWARNRPVWIADLTQQPRLRHAVAIQKRGLRTGFAFPIRLNREVLGVITIYSREVQPPDKHLLRLLRDICSQIGQVMGRRRAERQLLDISDREQQRIGRDLHDGLCQQLTGIAYLASELESRLTRRRLAEATTAARIATISRETATQARQIARGLNPVTLGPGGLTAALDALAGSIRSMFSIGCWFECPQRVAVPDHETAVHLYRIAQEAIHNALTHGKATAITISLARTPDAALLRVSDNGRGLAQGQRNGAGMGLQNMHYRARAIQATLQFVARPGGGTVTECRFGRHPGRIQ